MSTYALIVNGAAVEVFPPMIIDGKEIPVHERFTGEFVAQLQEVADGTEAAPIPMTPPTAPASVTMRQARLALLAAGKLDDVQSAIAAIPGADGDRARIEWEFAATVDRDSAFTQQLAQALGLDDAALDDLFTEAGAL